MGMGAHADLEGGDRQVAGEAMCDDHYVKYAGLTGEE